MEADSMARTTVKQTPASDSLSLRPTNGAVGLKLHWLPKHSSKVTSFCQELLFRADVDHSSKTPGISSEEEGLGLWV